MASGRREEKKALLRDRLYQTALELFREQGYEQTSVRQITQRAEVAKGTFFNHFPSKEHILVAWYDACDRESFEACSKCTYANALEAIKTLITHNIQRVLCDKDLLIAKTQVVYREALMADAEINQDAGFMAFCIQHLNEDQRAGRLDQTLDVPFFANLITTVATGTARRWVYQGGDFDMAASISRDLDFLFSKIVKE